MVSVRCANCAKLTLSGSFADLILLPSPGPTQFSSKEELFELTNPGQLHLYNNDCLKPLPKLFIIYLKVFFKKKLRFTLPINVHQLQIFLKHMLAQFWNNGSGRWRIKNFLLSTYVSSEEFLNYLHLKCSIQ